MIAMSSCIRLIFLAANRHSVSSLRRLTCSRTPTTALDACHYRTDRYFRSSIPWYTSTRLSTEGGTEEDMTALTETRKRVSDGEASDDNAHKKTRVGTDSLPSPTSPRSGNTKLIMPTIDSELALPDLPLLYHTALSAHHAAYNHYQQAFVPIGTQIPVPTEAEKAKPIPLYGKGEDDKYSHDPHAGHTALRLLILSLDLLRIGLDTPGISDIEKAAFGLEFATVGIKVIHATQTIAHMKAPQQAAFPITVNTKALLDDLEHTIATSMATAQRAPHLKKYFQGLVLASVRLATMMDKASQAKRIIKQALTETPKNEHHYRYSLQLLLLGLLRETRNGEFFKIATALQNEAKKAGHLAVVQLVHIARLRAHFDLRKWDNLGESLNACAAALGIEDINTSAGLVKDPLHTTLAMHFLHFKALHAGRAGDNVSAKRALRTLYRAMDEATDHGVFTEARASGGVLKIPLPSPLGPQELLVQTTPINVLYALTYLNTAVSRRSLFTTHTECRTLIHTRALRNAEDSARADDLWDSGVSSLHGVGDALQLRQAIMTLRVEVMMEEALALICRSSFSDADKLLTEIVELLRACNLFHTHIPQITLLYAQFAHCMGRPDVAVRYYRAAKKSLVPGSELRILVEIGLLGASGDLVDLKLDHERCMQVNILADACRCGSNAQLHAIGNFLSSLTDPEMVSSKRKLSQAYDISRKTDLHSLYALVFAFTTATHIYGDSEKQFRQLGTGAHVSKLLGGVERKDKIGQATLGLWYARKLQDHYRLSGDFDEEEKTRKRVEEHHARLNEIYAYSLKRFPLEPVKKERSRLYL